MHVDSLLPKFSFVNGMLVAGLENIALMNYVPSLHATRAETRLTVYRAHASGTRQNRAVGSQK